MAYFFLALTVFFIAIANIIGFVIFKKKRNLYFSAFIILILACVFGGIGSILAGFIIRDPFALFYGLNLASYLMYNSIIIFLLAIVVSVIKKIKKE